MDFRSKITRRNVLAAAMLLSVALALVPHALTERLRDVTHLALAPFADGSMYVETTLRARLQALGGRGLSPREADALRSRVEELELVVQRLQTRSERSRDIARTATNFRYNYGPLEDLKCELIPARVVALESLPYGQMRVLNPGQSARLLAGAPVTTRQIVHDCSKALPKRLAVVNAAYFLGTLTEETRSFTARLRLVTDREFRLRARVRRRIDAQHSRLVRDLSGDAAELMLTPENNRPIDAWGQGDGVARLVLPKVSALHEIRPGDYVYAYPDGAFAEIELYIGTVERVEPDHQDRRYVTVIVAPAADMSTLRDVFILHPLTLQTAGSG